MQEGLYIADTLDEAKSAKGIHLTTFNTGNGQAVQILLEELAEAYDFKWTTSTINIQAKEQKKEFKSNKELIRLTFYSIIKTD